MDTTTKERVHKKIMQTKDAFVNDDDFDPEEAMKQLSIRENFVLTDV